MFYQNLSSQKILQFSLKTWFLSLVLAQMVFVSYLTLGYGLASAANRFNDWNRFNSSAFVEGDTLGNLFYGLHVLLAIVMIVGGSLQLIPSVRNQFSAFHRVNGRIFVSLACLISIAGMYLILVRGTVGDQFLHSMTFFSGVVVLLSSVFAIKAAMRSDIRRHQIWAIRLFLAANGVLFFRLFIFAWFLSFGSLGVNTETFTGPAVYAVSLCSYLLPLLVFEVYRYVQQAASFSLNCLTSAFFFLTAAVFLLGLAGIVAGNWYPSVVNAL